MVEQGGMRKRKKGTITDFFSCSVPQGRGMTE